METEILRPTQCEIQPSTRPCGASIRNENTSSKPTLGQKRPAIDDPDQELTLKKLRKQEEYKHSSQAKNAREQLHGVYGSVEDDDQLCAVANDHKDTSADISINAPETHADHSDDVLISSTSKTEKLSEDDSEERGNLLEEQVQRSARSDHVDVTANAYTDVSEPKTSLELKALSSQVHGKSVGQSAAKSATQHDNVTVISQCPQIADDIDVSEPKTSLELKALSSQVHGKSVGQSAAKSATQHDNVTVISQCPEITDETTGAPGLSAIAATSRENQVPRLDRIISQHEIQCTLQKSAQIRGCDAQELRNTNSEGGTSFSKGQRSPESETGSNGTQMGSLQSLDQDADQNASESTMKKRIHNRGSADEDTVHGRSVKKDTSLQRSPMSGSGAIGQGEENSQGTDHSLVRDATGSVIEQSGLNRNCADQHALDSGSGDPSASQPVQRSPESGSDTIKEQVEDSHSRDSNIAQVTTVTNVEASGQDRDCAYQHKTDSDIGDSSTSKTVQQSPASGSVTIKNQVENSHSTNRSPTQDTTMPIEDSGSVDSSTPQKVQRSPESGFDTLKTKVDNSHSINRSLASVTNKHIVEKSGQNGGCAEHHTVDSGTVDSSTPPKVQRSPKSGSDAIKNNVDHTHSTIHRPAQDTMESIVEESGRDGGCAEQHTVHIGTVDPSTPPKVQRSPDSGSDTIKNKVDNSHKTNRSPAQETTKAFIEGSGQDGGCDGQHTVDIGSVNPSTPPEVQPSPDSGSDTIITKVANSHSTNHSPAQDTTKAVVEGSGQDGGCVEQHNVDNAFGDSSISQMAQRSPVSESIQIRKEVENLHSTDRSPAQETTKSVVEESGQDGGCAEQHTVESGSGDSSTSQTVQRSPELGFDTIKRQVENSSTYLNLAQDTAAMLEKGIRDHNRDDHQTVDGGSENNAPLVKIRQSPEPGSNEIGKQVGDLGKCGHIIDRSARGSTILGSNQGQVRDDMSIGGSGNEKEYILMDDQRSPKSGTGQIGQPSGESHGCECNLDRIGTESIPEIGEARVGIQSECSTERVNPSISEQQRLFESGPEDTEFQIEDSNSSDQEADHNTIQSNLEDNQVLAEQQTGSEVDLIATRDQRSPGLEAVEIGKPVGDPHRSRRNSDQDNLGSTLATNVQRQEYADRQFGVDVSDSIISASSDQRTPDPSSDLTGKKLENPVSVDARLYPAGLSVNCITPDVHLNGNMLENTNMASKSMNHGDGSGSRAGCSAGLGSCTAMDNNIDTLSAEYTQVNELGYLNSPKFKHPGAQKVIQNRFTSAQSPLDSAEVVDANLTLRRKGTEGDLCMPGTDLEEHVLSHAPSQNTSPMLDISAHGAQDESELHIHSQRGVASNGGDLIDNQNSSQAQEDFRATNKTFLEALGLTGSFPTLQHTQTSVQLPTHLPINNTTAQIPVSTHTFEDMNSHLYPDGDTPKSQLLKMLRGLNTVGTREELLARVFRLQRDELQPGDILVDYTTLASKGKAAAIKVAKAMGLEVEKMALSLNDIVDLLFTTQHENLSESHQHTLALHRNWNSAEDGPAEEYNKKWTQKYIVSTRLEKARDRSQSPTEELWSDNDLHGLPTKKVRGMLDGLNIFGNKEELIERVNRAKGDELTMNDIFVDFNRYAADKSAEKLLGRARLMGVLAGMENVKQLKTPEVLRLMFEYQHAKITLRDHERLAEFRGWDAEDGIDAKLYNRKWTEVNCLKGVKLRESKVKYKTSVHYDGRDRRSTGAAGNSFSHRSVQPSLATSNASSSRAATTHNNVRGRHAAGGIITLSTNTAALSSRENDARSARQGNANGLLQLGTTGQHRNTDNTRAGRASPEPQIPLVVDARQLGASLRTPEGECVYKLPMSRIRQLLAGYNTSGSKEELIARLGRAMMKQLLPQDVFVDYTSLLTKPKSVAEAIANELGLCTVDKSGGSLTVPAIIDLLFEHQYAVMTDEDQINLATHRGWEADDEAQESAQDYNRRMTREYVERTRLKSCRKENRGDANHSIVLTGTDFVDYTSSAYQKLSKTELLELAVSMGLDEDPIIPKTKKPKTAELIDFLFRRQQEHHTNATHQRIALTRGWTREHAEMADALSAREFNRKWMNKYLELTRMPKDNLNRLACTALPHARDLSTRQKQHALANHYALERETSLTPVNTLRELLKGLNTFGEREELVLRLDRANRNCLEVEDMFFDFCSLSSQPKAMAVDMAKHVGISVEVGGRTLTLPQVIDALFRQQQDNTSDEHHAVLATHRGWSAETHPDQDAREFNAAALTEHISASRLKIPNRDRGNPAVVDSFGFVDYTSATYTKLSKPELSELAQSMGLEVVGVDGKKLKTQEIIDLLFAAQHQELSDSSHTQIATSRGWTAESGLEATEFNERWTRYYVMYSRMARGEFTTRFLEILPHLEHLALKQRQYALAAHDALG